MRSFLLILTPIKVDKEIEKITSKILVTPACNKNYPIRGTWCSWLSLGLWGLGGNLRVLRSRPATSPISGSTLGKEST